MIQVIIKGDSESAAGMTLYEKLQAVEEVHPKLTSDGDHEFITIGVKTSDNDDLLDARFIILPKSKIQYTIDCLKTYL